MKYNDYYEADLEDRDDYLGSRSDIIKRSGITKLWTKVIEKAKDDIVRYNVLRTKKPNKNLEIERKDKEDAEEFLYNDEHLFAFDDYKIKIICPICNTYHITYMSNLSSGVEMCNNCSCFYSSEDVPEYEVEHITKEINLEELLSIIKPSKDINKFRERTKKEIELTIEAKLNG